MRKNNSLVVALALGAMTFVVSPVFAGYDASDVMLDQADHTAFSGLQLTLGLDGFTANSIGHLADENGRAYGPGTILIPYVGGDGVGGYGFPGCPTNVTDKSGNPISSAYNCVDDGATDADLIIQDVFGMVTEGDVTKAKGSQGIAQYLDSLFAGNTPSTTGFTKTFVDQTLDQDLADMSAGPSNQYGIWQRLHTSFNRNYDSAAGIDSDGLDQTIEAFMAEESGAANGTTGLTASGVIPGEVISYMAQWFQKGANLDCPTALCTHTEFGGHNTVASTLFVPNTTQHDP